MQIYPLASHISNYLYWSHAIFELVCLTYCTASLCRERVERQDCPPRTPTCCRLLWWTDTAFCRFCTHCQVYIHTCTNETSWTTFKKDKCCVLGTRPMSHSPLDEHFQWNYHLIHGKKSKTPHTNVKELVKHRGSVFIPGQNAMEKIEKEHTHTCSQFGLVNRETSM